MNKDNIILKEEDEEFMNKLREYALKDGNINIKRHARGLFKALMNDKQQ